MRLLKKLATRILRRPARLIAGGRRKARHCPVCGEGAPKFLPFGDPERSDAQCARCGSLERHRLIWLFFQRKTGLFDGTPKRMLHVAPEESLGKLLASVNSIDYVSADLTTGRRPTVQMDVTRIPCPDSTFDVLYASHVLEHIPDDRAALREFVRVLKIGGWAVLQVPITGETTDEDPGVIDPESRRRRFGQWDHVRSYGRDYQKRLAAAGFEVEVISYPAEFSAAELDLFGLDPTESIYFCRKKR